MVTSDNNIIKEGDVFFFRGIEEDSAVFESLVDDKVYNWSLNNFRKLSNKEVSFHFEKEDTKLLIESKKKVN
jgi:hypothetical protein